MKVLEFLKSKGISYDLTEHKPAFTAQRMAAAEHEPGRFVAKPVIVKADGKMIMCVLDANHKIDIGKLKSQLGAKNAAIADETEIGNACTDCELGAEAPIGSLYGMTTVMDKAMEKDDHIVFAAGSHDKAVKISMADFKKLAGPKLLDFSYHISL
jgi:Ala-tRNA(Pro) deacylase